MTAIRRSVVAAIGVASAVALLSPPAYAGNHDQAGTIKINNVEFEDLRPNVPHPTCDFVIAYSGFQEGETAMYSFSAQPPTGNVVLDGYPKSIALTPDGAVEENLADELAAFEPHPQQGYHVKLTVDVDDDKNQPAKHKVFWVDCPAPTAETTTTTTTTTEPPAAVTTTTETTLAPPEVQGVVETVAPPAAPADEVQGVVVTPPAPAAQVTELPRTGVGTVFLASLGGIFISLGTVLTRLRLRFS